MTCESGFSWVSAGLTDVGKMREVNEDAFMVHPDVGLWVVADGMGGHDAGDLASQAVVNSMVDIASPERMSVLVDEVEDRLLVVNKYLLEQAAARSEGSTIGSTVVVLLAMGNCCACLWAGDSRAYRLRDGVLKAITQDHSQVEELIEGGVLLREDAESHPAANVITRAVGASDELYVDIELDELSVGDIYLLCSDGLHKEVSEWEIIECMQKSCCEEICKQLVQLALERDCQDNITVVVVKVGDRSRDL